MALTTQHWIGIGGAYVGNWYGNTYLPNYWRRVTG